MQCNYETPDLKYFKQFNFYRIDKAKNDTMTK